jgi:hypothetical protein
VEGIDKKCIIGDVKRAYRNLVRKLEAMISLGENQGVGERIIFS